MGPLDFLNHFLNFVAPALGVAVLLGAFTLVFMQKVAVARVWWSQAAINVAVGVAVLVAGLVLLGRDGKMLTYLALMLAMATSQWWQLGGRKK
jgi:hypothetical protein